MENKPVNSHRRRVALDFGDEIAKLAARAPTSEIKRDLYACVKRINRLYGFSQEQKEQEILRLVHLGASSLQELVQESGFDIKYVCNILRRLETDNKVRIVQIRREGKGRPKMFITPAEP